MSCELPSGVKFMSHSDYPDYLVSECGRVYSLINCRFMRGGIGGQRGYRSVSILHGGRKVSKYVHRLVLEFKYGTCPPGMQACHCNGDHLDNRAENLRWGTPAENQGDREVHGTVTRGEGHPNSKLTSTVAAQIRSAWAAGRGPQRLLAAEFGISQSTISAVVRNARWAVEATQ